MALEHEMETFRKHLPALLATDENRFVLIHGDQVAGTWPTKLEAVEEGYRRFEFEPFLVMRIVANEKPIFVPREVAE
jgi:hypothetical protein